MRFHRDAWMSSAIGIGLLGIGYYLVTHVRGLRSIPAAQPSYSYADALARAERLQQRDQPQWRQHTGKEPLDPLCSSKVLVHGHRTERVIVFLHGFTKCPHQYARMATWFYEQGYNVLVPRLPYHGYADYMTTALSRLTTERLVECTQEVVDIACGLGEEVTVFGFSLGGLLASWVAQHRSDVDQVLIQSAPFTVYTVPSRFNSLYANLLTILPNAFIWWNADEKDKRAQTILAYPRFASRSFGHLLRLGLLVQNAARRTPPQAKRIVVSMNPTDESVDNRGAQRLVANWRKHGAAVDTYEFERTWQLAHEIIDPDHPAQQVARVYPVLVDLIAPSLATETLRD